MTKTATATSPSDTEFVEPPRRERMSLERVRDRLREAEAEWRGVVESLEQHRSTVRALARSVKQTIAQLAYFDREVAPREAPNAGARIQRQLDADQAADDGALKSYERFLATAERARARLHREMGRLRKEIRARDPRRVAKDQVCRSPSGLRRVAT